MHEKLMEMVVEPENCWLALRAVERNKGAPGIDGMRTNELREHLKRNWSVLRDKLIVGTYAPTPVRRKEISKPGGGTRTLGIPTVQDRFIQQALLQVMTAIYEPTFSRHSYGFRPGRKPWDAVRKAQEYAREGKTWTVDMDIKKFFDHVNHDILMTRIGRTIRDKRILKLIGRYLRAGAMIEGVGIVASEEGTPQGGPLSPLLANVYLDALDKELERRGHAFCRYADDCNIYVRSEAAAARVSENVTSWISKILRLDVNVSKSGIGQAWERTFLGFRLNKQLEIEVAPARIERFKEKTRELWRSCQSKSSEQLRDAWRAYVRGWWNYFRLAEDRRPLQPLSGWTRRHMRKCFWLRWHDAYGRQRALQRLGLRGRQLKVARSSRGAWRIAASHSLHTALSNARLRQHGFLTLSDLATT